MASPYDNIPEVVRPSANGGLDPETAAIMQLFREMLGQQQQMPNPMDAANADVARLAALRNDPQGDANRAYIPGGSGAGNPFTNGFFQNNASAMSPEARMATQGRSAMNQWAQLGGVPGVDANVLSALMAQQTPLPGPQATPNAETSDPYFQRRMQRMGVAPEIFGERMDLPMDLQGQYWAPFTEMLPGVVAADENTQYRRKKPVKANFSAGGSPLSGFKIGR